MNILFAAWLAMALPLPNPRVHSTLTAHKTIYTLWEFQTPNLRCPTYFRLSAVKGQTKTFSPRHLISCSGIIDMSTSSSGITIKVPSDDDTRKTFFYVYSYSSTSKSWLDKGRH